MRLGYDALEAYRILWDLIRGSLKAAYLKTTYLETSEGSVFKL